MSTPLAISPSSPEFDLVRRLADGDEQAFRDLYARHAQPMVRLAAVFVADTSVAEEVAQETWLAVLQQLETFEGRSSLKSWMYRILTNKAKKRGVRDKKVVPFTSLSTNDEAPQVLDPDLFVPDGHWKTAPRPWDEGTPERLAENAQTRAFVLEQVEALPEKERAVVRLRDLDLWTSEEVCELLEIAPGYQRVLLHRGRTRMRTALAEYLEREGS